MFTWKYPREESQSQALTSNHLLWEPKSKLLPDWASTYPGSGPKLGCHQKAPLPNVRDISATPEKQQELLWWSSRSMHNATSSQACKTDHKINLSWVKQQSAASANARHLPFAQETQGSKNMFECLKKKISSQREKWAGSLWLPWVCMLLSERSLLDLAHWGVFRKPWLDLQCSATWLGLSVPVGQAWVCPRMGGVKQPACCIWVLQGTGIPLLLTGSGEATLLGAVEKSNDCPCTDGDLKHRFCWGRVAWEWYIQGTQIPELLLPAGSTTPAPPWGSPSETKLQQGI